MILRNGNSIFILVLVSMVSFGQDIKMSVLSTQGELLKQVAQGEPFVVEVTVESELNDFTRPELKMPKQCQNRQTGIKMISTRGKSITTYLYTARIDKRVTYKLGPAKINQTTGTLQSNEYILTVADSTITELGNGASAAPMRKRKQSTVAPVLARLNLNKDSAVVGEKLRASLRFYKNDPTIDLQSIIEPNYDAQGWQIKNRTEPIQSQEEIDGTLYDYLEWQWELYPTKTGELTLPAYRVDYTVRSDREDIFSFILGSRISKTLYSNAVTVTIDPLPQGTKQVNAIGSFKSFTARLNPSMVHEGEGMTLLLELQGETDIDGLNVELSDLPEVVKSYPSKKYRKEDGSYCIEYILQARKSGEYEIPAQAFTYFDVDKKKYITLRTNPLPFTVLSSVVTQSSLKNEKKKLSDQPINSDELCPINADQWYPVHERFIGWLLYIYLIFIPLFIVILQLFSRALFNYLKTKMAFRKWLYSLRAKKQLDQAKKENDVTQLPIIFTLFFAELLENKNVERDEITIWMRSIISPQQIEQWQTFFQLIEEVRYFKNRSFNTQELFNQAYYWMTMLNKKVHNKKKIAAIIIFALLPKTLLLASDQERFLQANLLYNNGQWAQALNAYDKIKNKGGTVWYNMGHCCYNQQDYLKSYFYWKKASLHTFNKDYDNAVFNKNKVATKLGLQEHESWFSAVEKKALTLVVQLLFLFFWYILLWYAAVLFRKQQLLLVVLICATVATGSVVGIKYRKSIITEGIIAQDTECFSGPCQDYHMIARIGKATCVKIIEQQEEWIKIQTKTDRGWIRKEAVLIL